MFLQQLNRFGLDNGKLTNKSLLEYDQITVMKRMIKASTVWLCFNLVKNETDKKL